MKNWSGHCRLKSKRKHREISEMAFPSSSHDLRLIRVNEKVFRWRLALREINSVVVVYGPIVGHQGLQVTLRGWINVWAVFPLATNNKPHAITPSFARRMVEYGLGNGWKPEVRGAPFKIEWNGEEFSLAAPNSGGDT
jgi:hypothetical protein